MGLESSTSQNIRKSFGRKNVRNYFRVDFFFFLCFKLELKNVQSSSGVYNLQSPLLQIAAPKLLHWSRDKRALIGMEVKEILEKVAIAQVCH